MTARNDSARSRSQPPSARLADRIVGFARVLRRAGMRVGPAAVMDAIQAVLAVGIERREDFYWTLHATLVSRREDHALFEEAFRLYWARREERDISDDGGEEAEVLREKPRTAARRAEDALDEERRGILRRKPEFELDARLSFTAMEVLRRRDFAQMSAAELAEARLALRDLVLPFDRVATRRFRPDPRGVRVDPRAMLRLSLRTGGDLILPKFRSPRRTAPPLVALVDISGSMSQYSRIFLHFLHALTEKRRRVASFTFGTRLTNITRPLTRRDPDEALAEASKAVRDWSGGTRIGTALEAFNRLWSRRVLGQGAIVLLITDGLERDHIEVLSREMERLHKSCRRLIWLNPLLGFDGFEPRARGMRAMLPHVDELRPVHSLDALSDLCAALQAPGRRFGDLAPGHRHAHMGDGRNANA
ncbi:vWA domain-containing protein [Nitratireductor pacificus]|uniref:VWA containing CoxE-like protein n=1 Tax=Nitratireductor pacificus pht-3B TaxID=391937 RepID=K2MC28_9HYPH|nr:VWA domain-containing protein [Nitratireductor pacificus]EKF19676.1 VWA containing CoxE-like protein [Nitratireductor pacificus pht-3B]